MEITKRQCKGLEEDDGSSHGFAAPVNLPTDDERFLIELEFVQNLSNPKYLNYLAQRGYLEQISFLNFLRYLRYWKQPPYLQLIIFPHCLAFLDALIDNEDFRRELLFPHFIDFVHQQQGSHWMWVRDDGVESLLRAHRDGGGTGSVAAVNDSGGDSNSSGGNGSGGGGAGAGSGDSDDKSSRDGEDKI